MALGGVGFLPSGGLGGWAPGSPPHRFPEGAARPIPANADLVVQIHFHPSGKVETEQSTIGLYLTDKAPVRAVTTLPLGVRSNIDSGSPGVLVVKIAMLRPAGATR